MPTGFSLIDLCAQLTCAEPMAQNDFCLIFAPKVCPHRPSDRWRRRAVDVTLVPRTKFLSVPGGTQDQSIWLGGCEGLLVTFSREGNHMCRLVFAAVTLITIHSLCKDLATEELSTHARASLVPPRSLAISALKSTAACTSPLRQVQTCNSGK
jgi:hypothetical protein